MVVKCALLSLSFLLSSLATAHAADWHVPEGGAPGASRPRVVILGDSNIYGSIGKALEDRFVADGWEVWRRARPGSGLTHARRYDWFASAAALIAKVKPSVVVAQMGGNDVFALKWPARAAHFAASYRERARAFMSLLAADGRQVFWLSPTNRGPGAQRAATIRDLQREASTGLARVDFVDMFPITSDEHGRWLRVIRDANGREVVVRRRDAIHLNDEGGAYVSERVIARMRDDGLPLR